MFIYLVRKIGLVCPQMLYENHRIFCKRITYLAAPHQEWSHYPI